jgi:hypothetical protein
MSILWRFLLYVDDHFVRMDICIDSVDICIDSRAVDNRGVDNRGVDNRGVDNRGVDGRGVDGRGVDGRGVDGRGVDNRGVDGIDDIGIVVRIVVRHNHVLEAPQVCFDSRAPEESQGPTQNGP